MTDETKNPEGEKNAQPANSGAGSEFLDMVLPPVSQTVEYHDDEPEPTEGQGQGQVSPEPKRDDPESARGLLDDKGAAFDPSLHVYPPEKTAGGKWRRIPKRQREAQQESGEIAEPNSANRMEAQKAASIYASLHAVPFPDDFKPTAESFAMLTDAIEQYYNENGAIELPADLNLGLVMAQYTAEIAQRESNIEKVKRWGRAAWGFVSGSKKRKQKDVAKSEAKRAQDAAEKRDAK